MNGNELVVKFENDAPVRPTSAMHVVISGPDMDALRLKGSGSPGTIGNLNTNELSISISGSGDINIPILMPICCGQKYPV